MSNDNIISAVRAALEHDTDVNLHDSDVRITYQDTLRLEGEVPNIIAKRRALRIAMSAARTTEIDDRLHIRPGEQRVDEALRETALELLREEPAFRDIHIAAADQAAPDSGGGRIQVDAKGCVVILKGKVGSLSHRRLAEVIAWWAPGSCDVDNRLQVEPAEQETDAELSDAIRLVLDKDPSLRAGDINIQTRNREVTLYGAVHTREQKRMASYDCWYVPGVHGVHNKLEVRSG
jgi:osmotically-inducible protein OsmY